MEQQSSTCMKQTPTSYSDAYHSTVAISLTAVVRTHYVQISNIIDTSIKRQISGQFTTVVKG